MKYPAQIFPDSSDLTDHQKLYQKVFEQLEKDFYPFISSIHPEPLTAESIFLAVEKALKQLLSSTPDRLQQILYKVDLRPHELNKCYAAGLLQVDQLIVSIVKREALKVWLRANPT